MGATEKETIALFLSGDVMLGRGIDQVLPWPCEPTLYEPCMGSAKGYVALAEEANGVLPTSVDIRYPWGDALDELKARPLDARIINLETSVTRHSQPLPKGINYRMSPENFACVKAAGIDCCVLANNHVLDWGEAGLIETLDTIAASAIATAGAGRDLIAATAPAMLTISPHQRLVIYACACADSGVPSAWGAGDKTPGINLLPDLSVDTARRIGAQIEAVRQQGDIVMASIHWGSNWGYTIAPSHRRFAQALVDEAGIDLVHGHSSHHPKAIEVHHGRLILYGCGDFITDYEGISGHESFRDDLVVMYLPALRGRDGGLQGLIMIPFQIRNFRLNRAARRDAEWLCSVLRRECSRFAGDVALDDAGALRLEWS
jgi:poly-gamma-glutamate synthesis protein (capsule biosynthesis protein)